MIYLFSSLWQRRRSCRFQHFLLCARTSNSASNFSFYLHFYIVSIICKIWNCYVNNNKKNIYLQKYKTNIPISLVVLCSLTHLLPFAITITLCLGVHLPICFPDRINNNCLNVWCLGCNVFWRLISLLTTVISVGTEPLSEFSCIRL